MGSLKKSYSSAGYDQEEHFFFKLEQELIEKVKGRPNLKVIDGGKSDEPANKGSQPRAAAGKKAA
jgi:hypothetical protein